jgi:hypothetical protein
MRAGTDVLEFVGTPADVFDADHYLSQIDSAVPPSDAEQHFLTVGLHLGLSPHPLVDPSWLMAQAGLPLTEFDIARLRTDPRMWGLSPHPLFDTQFYLANNADVAAAGISPLLHYLNHGWRENRRPNLLFDNYWYLAANPDVRASNICPLTHYIRYGSREGRQPHPYFDPQFYSGYYPDVRAGGAEAFAHYVAYGLREGRLPSPQLYRLASSDIAGVDYFAVAMTEKHLANAGSHSWYGIFSEAEVEILREKVVESRLSSDQDVQIFRSIREKLSFAT